jgi:hypothetical protein
MLRLTVVLTAWAWLGAIGAAIAHPTDSFPPDARPEGMAGAFTAVADGPFAIWWNPAGLGLTQPLSFTPFSRTEFEPLIGQSPYGYAFGASGHWGHFGLGFALTSIGGGLDSDGAGFTSGRGILLGGGVDLMHYMVPWWRGLRFCVGATVKHLSELSGRGYGTTCQGIPSAWNVDLGALLSYRLSHSQGGVELEREAPERPLVINRNRRKFVPLRRTDDSAYAGLRAGLLLRNLLDHSVSCVQGELYQPMHPALRIGAAIEGGLQVIHPFGPLLTGIVSLEEEIVHRREDPLDQTARRNFTVTRAGAEAGVLGILAARAGRVHDPGREVDGWSWGAGLGLDLWNPGGSLGQLGARLDFASLPEVEDYARTEHWTLTFWVLH